MVELNDLAKLYAPWSASKAGQGLVCPKQFAYKYIEKKPEIVTQSVNRVGTAAHSILELRLQERPLKDARKEAVDKTTLTSKETEDLQVHVDAIESFVSRFDVFCKGQGIVERLIEQKWGITKDFKATSFFAPDVFFRGVIDLGGLTKNNDLIVIDHKSGKINPLGKYQAQLNSYAVLGLANYPDIDGVQSAIHFLQGDTDSSRIQWAHYQSRDVIEKNLKPWMYEYLNDCANALQNPYKATPGKTWPCKWCAYSPICDEYQRLING